jgi:hypothetical protein
LLIFCNIQRNRIYLLQDCSIEIASVMDVEPDFRERFMKWKGNKDGIKGSPKKVSET